MFLTIPIPRAWLLIAGCLLLAGVVGAQDGSEIYNRRPSETAKARKQYEDNLRAHEGNEEILVLPGLVADRKRRSVEVLAESTGLAAEETVEFLLLGQESSHGYEGLFWSFAKPSDVHRALEFIGLKSGTPRNLALLGLGSDGDRVNVSVRMNGGPAVPAERLILDKEADKTLPEDGFVFAGSMQALPAAGAHESGYVADLYDPRAVVPLYSEPAAVLDIPRQVEKGEAYGRQVVNPERVAAKGALVTVIMTPRGTNGQAVARRVVFSVDVAAGGTGTVYRLTGTNGTVFSEAPALTPPLERLMAFKKDDAAVPGVDLSFGNALPIEDVRKVCAVLGMMEAMGAVKVRPPADGQLYYRAFLPDRAWFTPEGRPSQPWEVHLRLRDGKATGQLVQNEPLEDGDGQVPRFRRKTHDVPTPESLRKALDADTKGRVDAGRAELPDVLLVFVDPGVAYGQIVRFLAPVLGTHGTVYVFEDGTAPSPEKKDKR